MAHSYLLLRPYRLSVETGHPGFPEDGLKVSIITITQHNGKIAAGPVFYLS
jgi:hypothetical protein